MRRIQWRVAILIIAILFVVLCSAVYTKPGMMITVRLLEDRLTSYAEARVLEGGDEGVLSKTHIGFGNYIYVCPSSGGVFFSHPGLNTTGFFYSTSGKPIGYQGADAVFEKQGDGWLWEESNGDNWMYAEHIIGNWYWYEMHF